MISSCNSEVSVDSLQSWSSTLNDKKDFYLFHVNIRSIKKYYNDLIVTCKGFFAILDVIVITEPNIPHSMLSMYSISGYDLNSYTRPNRKGGGVLIYTHTDLAARVIEPPLTMLTAECVIVSINKNNIEIIIVGIYRPPKINQENKVVQFLDELNLLLKKINNDKIIICGDCRVRSRGDE